MHGQRLIEKGKSFFKFYIKNDCSGIVKTAAADVADGIRRITGVLPETQKVDDFDKVKGGIILAKFSDGDFADKFKSEYDYLKDSDGFTVKSVDGNVYVLSHCDAGVFYGLHDFLEKNADIIWARGAYDYAVETLPSESIILNVCDYTEKSPFKVRVWNTCGTGTDGVDHGDTGMAQYLGRNKIQGVYHHCNDDWYDYAVVGQSLASAEFRDIDDLMDEHPEYFMTDENGVPRKTEELESYVNYYHPDVPKIYAKRMVDYLLKHHPEDVLGYNMPDDPYFCMVHGGVRLDKQPFTADDGTTVYPEDANYKSTVYFNFINRLIKEINDLLPDTIIHTQAYMYSEKAPAIHVDDRVIIKVAPLTANEKVAHNDPVNSDNYPTRDNILSWLKKSNSVCLNAYWNSFKGDMYSRPILKVVQQNLKWWRDVGVIGFTPEGKVDCGALKEYSEKQAFARKFFDLNEFYTWGLSRLAWNPDQDIEELKERYCRIVYKECAKEMREYFNLIEKGWDNTPAYVWYATGADVYIYQLIVKAGVKDGVLNALETACKKAVTPTVKSRVESIYSTVKGYIDRYADFIKEDAAFAYCGGVDPLSSEQMDFISNPDSVWNKAKPQTVLRSYDDMKPYDKDARFSRRMLYDDKYLYFGYMVYDDKIIKAETIDGRLRVFRDDGTELRSRAETYIGGNSLNRNRFYGFVSGFNAHDLKDVLYVSEGVPKSMPMPEDMKDVKKVYLSDDPKERRYFHVQVVPIELLGVSNEDLKPYGHFVYYTDRYGRSGWMGFGLWSLQNFSDFKLEK
ncbi:MAG: DUF4838 domain-containing protein [Clostridia bacterium]|nr:DUF4838 domain-containing protein [Clostridia bacterium]